MLVVDTPLGARFDGRPIWPYLGSSEGAPEGSAGGDEGESDDDDGDTGGSEETYSPSVRKALERERADAKNARDALRPWRVLAKELGVKGPEEIRNRLTALTQDQTAAAEDRDRRDAEILTKANKRILRAEVRALAAESFADAGDAVLYLDLDEYEVDEDGNVPSKKIKTDLEDLLKRKPHLAKKSTKVDYEGGARRTAEGPKDMNSTIRNLARRR